jgi:Co/Zn/Cd efflux system component
MSKLKETFKLLGSFVLLIALTYLAGWGIWESFKLFSNLEPPVKAAIITAIVGFTSLTASSFYTSQRETRLKLREKKVEVYSRFLKAWVKALLDIGKIEVNDETSNQAYQDKIQNFSKELREITDDLLLWGSDEIIKEYSYLRINLPNESSTDIEKNIGIVRFGKFMLSLRKDLGHNNKNIDEYDLLSLFVNDIDIMRVVKPQIDELLKTKS